MFEIFKRDIADVEPTEYLKTAETLALGCAAKLGESGLVKASGNQKPTHIVAGIPRADGLVPALRVQPTTVFETTSTAAVAAAGGTVQLHTDGLQVTAAAGGPFAVEYTENKAGGIVRGRFV